MCSVAIDPTMSALLDAFWTSIDTTREPAWLTDRRTTGMNAFLAMGLPTTDDEAWRFTNLRPLVSAKGLPAPAVDGIADPAFIAANRLPGKASNRDGERRRRRRSERNRHLARRRLVRIRNGYHRPASRPHQGGVRRQR